VPGQLSVIGFDDVEAASYLGLTTVRQQLELSGAWGAQMLLELAGGWGPREPVSQKLSLELVKRRTTGEPGRL
jgi:LacI family transcriptional regulator